MSIRLPVSSLRLAVAGLLGLLACSEPLTVQPTFIVVSAGAHHTCGVTLVGTAFCWGANTSFELGDGTAESRNVPGRVAGRIKFVSVSVGLHHTCGVAVGGIAYCWGYNFLGQLGDGTLIDRSTPTAVEGGLTFARVSAGLVHTCGVTTDGVVHCWGANGNGQLGSLVASLNVPQPTPVSGGLSFSSVSVGPNFTCAITTAGAAYCWGDNAGGQLGNGNTTGPDDCPGPCSRTPVPVSGGITFVTIATGSWHTCGLTTEGTTYCWGGNQFGQPGLATTPVRLPGDLTFIAVTAGGGYTCGLLMSGAAYCWGVNNLGQLGNGATSTIPEITPVPVSGGLRFAHVSAGADYACGVSQSDGIYCWGYNNDGQLGDGTSGDSSSVPVPVAP